MTPLYAGIGGVVRELTEMYTGVGSVVKPMTEMWAGVDGVNRQIFSSGTPVGDLAIGDVVQINENGAPQEYIIVHQGRPSSLYDTSCTGTWLLRRYLPNTNPFNHAWNSNGVNTYAASDINSYLNSTILGLYDAEVSAAIKPVKIPYCVGNGTKTIMSGSSGLLCKVFVLSCYEVGYTTSIDINFPEDGKMLGYFLNGDSTTANKRRIALNPKTGMGTGYCLRSPYMEGTEECVNIGWRGIYNSVSVTNPTFGIRPCFILPQDFVL